MKKVVLMAVICSIIFSGCTGLVTKHEYTQEEINKAYTVSKGAYKVGKEVVKVVAPKIPVETMDTLKIVDEVATSIDGAVSEKKPSVVDTNSAETK